MTDINALRLREAKEGFWGKIILYAGVLLVLSGAAWLASDMLMDLAFGQLPKGFEEIV